MKYRVPFIKPSFPSAAKISLDYKNIIDSNWFTNFGPFEKQFCKKAEMYLGKDIHVTTVANATLGLDLAIRALMVRRGKKNQVIIPSFTFAAGPEVLISNQFTPVFIDIDQTTLQPNIDEAIRYIRKNRKKVAGILLCNIFGVGNTEIKKWEKLAKDTQLPLIIDSAAGFGSEYNNGEMVGGRGDCEVFSMHATKPFSVGEGGIISSKNMKLIEELRRLQNFGFVDRKIVSIGTNAKLQEINCAIGLRQLEKYQGRLLARRLVLTQYKKSLNIAGYSFQDNDDNSTVPFVTTLAPTKKIAEKVYQKLISEGIEVRRYYAPLHKEKYLTPLVKRASRLSVTTDVASRILSLPVHDGMSRSIVKEIVDTILSASGAGSGVK